ncbi:hypothetical protein [Paenibacillus popilliae]|uniref:hypothetical protein n=1 Tax=Paenibacillus popilliae TaxID=78057 RepID=UPI0005A8B696|nr:hypothetical protein [Paenibacillus popilliae]
MGQTGTPSESIFISWYTVCPERLFQHAIDREGVVLAGAEQSRVYGQIGSTIGCREHVERAPSYFSRQLSQPQLASGSENCRLQEHFQLPDLRQSQRNLPKERAPVSTGEPSPMTRKQRVSPSNPFAAEGKTNIVWNSCCKRTCSLGV